MEWYKTILEVWYKKVIDGEISPERAGDILLGTVVLADALLWENYEEVHDLWSQYNKKLLDLQYGKTGD